MRERVRECVRERASDKREGKKIKGDRERTNPLSIEALLRFMLPWFLVRM